MTVADRQKTILVTGDRVWQDGVPSDPQPFESMPLVWERAFGGVHRDGDKVAAEERNPVGCGFAGGRSAAAMQGLPSRTSRIRRRRCSRSASRRRRPASRRSRRRGCRAARIAGTYDERWQRARAPYLPDDFDPRFFQCAAPEFAFDRYLQAGEHVQVVGVLPDGPIAFTVPDVASERGGHGCRRDAPSRRRNLETLSIEPDENRACFTWRAAVPCDRKALKVEKIVVSRAGARS